MNAVFLTAGQVIQLLEKGSVNAGSCLIVNIDKEVDEYVR